MAYQSFEDLDVWQRACALVVNIYRELKDSHHYGFREQISRAAVSIPSNIAEGTSKGTDKHFLQYLETALGSAFEWETQLIISFEIGYISEKTFKHLEIKIQNIQGMITRFMEKLTKS